MSNSSCIQCEVSYLRERVDLQEVCLRRMQNKMGFAHNTAEVVDAQRKNVDDMTAFAVRWKNGRACTHQSAVPIDDTTTDMIADVTETFTPAAPTTPSEPLFKEGGNIGLNSVPSRAFQETRRPKQGDRGGRPPVFGGKGKTGGGSATGGRSRR